MSEDYDNGINFSDRRNLSKKNLAIVAKLLTISGQIHTKNDIVKLFCSINYFENM